MRPGSTAGGVQVRRLEAGALLSLTRGEWEGEGARILGICTTLMQPAARAVPSPPLPARVRVHECCRVAGYGTCVNDRKTALHQPLFPHRIYPSFTRPVHNCCDYLPGSRCCHTYRASPGTHRARWRTQTATSRTRSWWSSPTAHYGQSQHRWRRRRQEEQEELDAGERAAAR